MTTPLWLSKLLRLFLYSSVYSCHLFLTSSDLLGLKLFLFVIMPILAWNAPLISPSFFEEISSLSHAIVSFISLHCSFRKVFLFLLAALWNSAFSWVYLSLSALPFTFLLSSAICKASSDNHFAFSHIFFSGMVWSLPPCYQHLSIALQSLCLPDITPWICSSPPLDNHRDLI